MWKKERGRRGRKGEEGGEKEEEGKGGGRAESMISYSFSMHHRNQVIIVWQIACF